MQALTTEQYTALVRIIKSGHGKMRASPRIAAALMAEANLGMRIGDILRLRLDDIILDGKRYRLNIVEEKTGKRRTFTVPEQLYRFFCNYCTEQKIPADQPMFPTTVRSVQRHIKSACEILGYSNVSTHSFRKWYATDIYEASGHDIVLVQQLLQHSSPNITRRYIGISDEKIEKAIAGHVLLA